MANPAIPPLISLDEAKLHLRIALDNTDYDQDVTYKIQEASEMLMDWIKKTTVPPEWMDPGPPVVMRVPALVTGAMKLMLASLHENREAEVSNVISPAVQALLQRLWDPALA
jgi:Phage gp6-like head-tail connector protein